MFGIFGLFLCGRHIYFAAVATAATAAASSLCFSEAVLLLPHLQHFLLLDWSIEDTSLPASSASAEKRVDNQTSAYKIQSLLLAIQLSRAQLYGMPSSGLPKNLLLAAFLLSDIYWLDISAGRPDLK